MLVPQWGREWTGSNGRWGGGWQQWAEAARKKRPE